MKTQKDGRAAEGELSTRARPALHFQFLGRDLCFGLRHISWNLQYGETVFRLFTTLSETGDSTVGGFFMVGTYKILQLVYTVT